MVKEVWLVVEKEVIVPTRTCESWGRGGGLGWARLLHPIPQLRKYPLVLGLATEHISQV